MGQKFPLPHLWHWKNTPSVTEKRLRCTTGHRESPHLPSGKHEFVAAMFTQAAETFCMALRKKAGP